MRSRFGSDVQGLQDRPLLHVKGRRIALVRLRHYHAQQLASSTARFLIGQSLALARRAEESALRSGAAYDRTLVQRVLAHLDEEPKFEDD